MTRDTQASRVVECVGCGGEFPDVDGPTHRYLGSCAGCWAAFGEVLAREYSDREYREAHRFTVDAYALQHPGKPSQQTIRSVALHGISLCAIFDLGASLEDATRIIRQATHAKDRFVWLTPPPSMGELTIEHVRRTRNREDHARVVREWAMSVWRAWSKHHPAFRDWVHGSWDE